MVRVAHIGFRKDIIEWLDGYSGNLPPDGTLPDDGEDPPVIPPDIPSLEQLPSGIALRTNVRSWDETRNALMSVLDTMKTLDRRLFVVEVIVTAIIRTLTQTVVRLDGWPEGAILTENTNGLLAETGDQLVTEGRIEDWAETITNALFGGALLLETGDQILREDGDALSVDPVVSTSQYELEERLPFIVR